jgi:hypothetical protein
MQPVTLQRLLYTIQAEIDTCPALRRSIVLRGLAVSLARSLLLAIVVTPALLFWLIVGYADGVFVLHVTPALRTTAGLVFGVVLALALAAGPRPRQIIDSEIRRRVLAVTSL